MSYMLEHPVKKWLGEATTFSWPALLQVLHHLTDDT